MSNRLLFVLIFLIPMFFLLIRSLRAPLPAWTQPSRAGRENRPLAGWKYSDAEWENYLALNSQTLKVKSIEILKADVGVDISSKYITFSKGSSRVRLLLDGKCVRTADCSVTGGILNFMVRIRHPQKGWERHDRYQKLFHQLPIPPGCENQAAQVVEYFKILIREEAENITEIYGA